MNILIHRYNSICEPDYIDAFKAMGVEVIEDRAEMYNKNISADQRIGTLAEMIMENHPTFVFTINFFPYISAICERLGVLYVCVSVDCPVAELYSVQVKNACNRIFLFDYQQYLEVHPFNPECVFHMPLGVNVERINETVRAPIWERKYKYGISLVGSLYNEKSPYPEVCQKLPLHEWGYAEGLLAAQRLLPGQSILEEGMSGELVKALKSQGGKDFSIVKNQEDYLADMNRYVAVNHYLSPQLSSEDRMKMMRLLATEVGGVHLFTRSDTSPLADVVGDGLTVHGGVQTLTEMPLVFRESKINLNPTIRSIQMGLPQRIWDVLGCGGFLMTNYQAELPEYFEIGKHLVAYESPEEMVELAKYYLEHEQEREEIARCGYEYVKSQHTVRLRVMEMIRVMTGG